MVKPTPGPWKIHPHTPARISSSDGKFNIATVHVRADVGVQDANASLIAAAPDLLAALTKWRAYAWGQDKGNAKQLAEMIAAADAAIAKVDAP